MTRKVFGLNRNQWALIFIYPIIAAFISETFPDKLQYSFGYSAGCFFMLLMTLASGES